MMKIRERNGEEKEEEKSREYIDNNCI